MTDVVKTAPRDVLVMVEQSRDGLSAALADRIGVDRFMRAAVTTLRTTPALRNCTPESVLGGLFLAAQLGLEVGGPLAYAHVVPYGKDAQLIVGVRGFVELFYRAGASDVQAYIVREGDDIHRETVDGRVRVFWRDADPLNTSRKPIGALAEVTFPNGGVIQELMSREQILKRKPRTSTRGPWSDWEEEMWKKTVLRQCAKTARLSSDDLALAVEADQTITVGERRKAVPVGGVEEQPITVAELPESSQASQNGGERNE